jgi:hypothetical protein
MNNPGSALRCLVLGAVACVLALPPLMLPAPLAAQASYLLLSPVDAITGRLSSSDPTFNGRGSFAAYQFDARAGDRLLVEMRSDDFDAFLSIAGQVGQLTDVIATDDDGGGGTDSRLLFRAPADGRYFLIAQSFSPESSGAYRLQLSRAPEPAAARAIRVEVPALVEGRLRDTSPILADESRYDLYTFRGRAGQRVVITMRATEFDSFLSLLRAGDDTESPLATDDDGAGDLNARIRFRFAADGDYMIHAGSLGATAEGAYTLELRDDRSAPRISQALVAERSVAATLTEEDEQLDNGSYFHDWLYSARAGESLTITMRSDDFDAFLDIGRMVNGRFESLASDDDSAGGTHARLSFTAPGAGEFTVRARSFDPDATGSYSLTLERTR